ncbi:hypothetical protein ACX93W_09815 [Paenibacillus sp. CAU 1782]
MLEQDMLLSIGARHPEISLLERAGNELRNGGTTTCCLRIHDKKRHGLDSWDGFSAPLVRAMFFYCRHMHEFDVFSSIKMENFYIWEAAGLLE